MTDEVIKKDSEKMSDTKITTDGTSIHVVRRSTIDRDNGYLTSYEDITICNKDGEQKKINNQCSLQIYTMKELREMLGKNGFKTIEQHKIDTYTFQNDDAGYAILTVAEKI